MTVELYILNYESYPQCENNEIMCFAQKMIFENETPVVYWS